MSENEAPLTTEQEAALKQEAAAHTQAQPNPAGEQAATNAQMTDRGPLLPAEEEIEKLMAAFRQQADQISKLQGQLGTMQQQQDAALASQGGPLATRYATAVADKVQATIAAHPDAPADHFAPLVEAASALKEHAGTIVKGTNVMSDLEAAAGKVTKFIDKTHVKAWGKSIDWSALADDVEAAVVEAAKLVPAL